jgi:hypothetical protein
LFLYSDLCVYGLKMGLYGFAAKTPDVTELLSKGTCRSGHPLYFTFMYLSFPDCSALVW